MSRTVRDLINALDNEPMPKVQSIYAFHDEFYNAPVLVHRYASWQYPSNYAWFLDARTNRYWTYKFGQLWTPYVRYGANNSSWLQWIDRETWDSYSTHD